MARALAIISERKKNNKNKLKYSKNKVFGSLTDTNTIHEKNIPESTISKKEHSAPKQKAIFNTTQIMSPLSDIQKTKRDTVPDTTHDTVPDTTKIKHSLQNIQKTKRDTVHDTVPDTKKVGPSEQSIDSKALLSDYYSLSGEQKILAKSIFDL